LDQERMVLLLAPPFRPGGPDPGYIAAYPPGIRENGGQYTHAAAWLGWAHIAMLDGDEAYRVASLLNPLERATGSAEVEKYRVEPYVLAGDIYGREPFMGRGGWTWYTGAAAWTWRLVIEGILGLRRVDGCLEVVPCLPSHFDGFEAWIKWASCEVHVIVRRTDGPDSARVVIDGHRAPRARVDLSRAGTRTVEIWLDLPAGSRTLQAQNF